jgi:hypothetical protein
MNACAQAVMENYFSLDVGCSQQPNGLINSDHLLINLQHIVDGSFPEVFEPLLPSFGLESASFDPSKVGIAHEDYLFESFF